MVASNTEPKLIDRLKKAKEMIRNAVVIIEAGYQSRLGQLFMNEAVDPTSLSDRKQMYETMSTLVKKQTEYIDLISQYQPKIVYLDEIIHVLEMKEDFGAAFHKDQLQNLLHEQMAETGINHLLKGVSMIADQVKYSIPLIINTVQNFNPESDLLKEEMPSLN